MWGADAQAWDEQEDRLRRGGCWPCWQQAARCRQQRAACHQPHCWPADGCGRRQGASNQTAALPRARARVARWWDVKVLRQCSAHYN